MPPKKKSPSPEPMSVPERVSFALQWLEGASTEQDRENLRRFGINAKPAFGVSMANLKVLAKELGRNHELAAGLWETGWYEARMLAALIDEPARVTSAQMDRWCGDFDNWGICDTVCFQLFDRVPNAWSKVKPWSRRKEEFAKRAGFALLASLALHDKNAEDARFVETFALIEQGASDDRNFVKKAVNWALRAIGGRNRTLHAGSVALAERLAASTDPTPRWIGKDALRQLNQPATAKRLSRGSTRSKKESEA